MLVPTNDVGGTCIAMLDNEQSDGSRAATMNDKAHLSVRPPKSSAASALIGIWTILLIVFAISVLYVGRDVLVPLALAALITFLLSPVVGYLERFIGRIASVLLMVTLLFAVLASGAWLLTRQVIDLAAKLPDYQTNIEAKLHSFRVPAGGAFGRFTNSIQELRNELPGGAGATPSPAPSPSNAERKTTRALTGTSPAPSASPVPVTIVKPPGEIPQMLQAVAGTVLSPLGSTALVLLLVIFMLLQREDLRGRLMRLVGGGHISETTHAFDDAGQRVRRYLAMQFLVNTGYGVLIATGLYFIGVPNAALWGAVAGVLRFIPYVGPWIGAAIPLLLSFAISKSWLTPICTLALFGVLELINSNALEPWLYGSSTGVSSLALIVAALFWTWLWGPIGLLLSTPLTVCVTVLGQHVPRMNFLSVLLSEEAALSPAEELYHRLLALGVAQAGQLADTYLKENSLTAFYDFVVLPVITAAEVDLQRHALDPDERSRLYENLTELVEDYGSRPPVPSQLEADKAVAIATPPPPQAPTCRVLCLPVRSERDALAGLMLAQILRQQGFDAESTPGTLSQGELVERAVEIGFEAICISVVPPSTLGHARLLAEKLRARLREVKIVVGFWGATENMGDATQRMRAAGVDEVVVTFSGAVVQLSKYSGDITDEMMIAPRPPDEDTRQAQLDALGIVDSGKDRALDRMTARLAGVFQVPIALISFIDRDRQWFKSQTGLPDDLAAEGETQRDLSICGHMIAGDEMLVVEDVRRDRRFANNPLLKERGIRFYAGAPLRVSGQPIGSLCLLDIRARKFSQEDRRVLQLMADEVMEEINEGVEVIL
jgi:predicted PurR-regulated permease PerM/GAF domain-containing protein